MATEYCRIEVTCPEDRAEALAEKIFEAKLAACVHISSPFKTIYEWEGKIEHGCEVTLALNTHRDKYAEIEAFARANHPFECPSITMHLIDNGYKEYFKWIDDSLAG